MTTTTLPRAFDIQVNGKSREIFMSVGLLNELGRHVGGIENVGAVTEDLDLRERMLAALLAERTRSGKVTQAISVDDLDLDPMDVVALIEWATGWLVDFFINLAEAAKRVMAKNQERVNSLIASPAGTQG